MNVYCTVYIDIRVEKKKKKKIESRESLVNENYVVYTEKEEREKRVYSILLYFRVE
jgi:hypothetical protein